MKTSIVVVALALAIGLSGCGVTGQANSDLEDMSVFVHVKPVQAGTLDRTLDLTGMVEAGQSVNLLPDIPGKVASLPVKVGQEVHEGDVLARLDLEMVELQQRQASAAVKLAELGLETANREFARAEALHKTGSLTDQMFEQAKTGLEMAELQLTQAHAAQGLARRQVTGGVLKAPFDGLVSSVACEEGEYFNPMTVSPMGGPKALVGLVNLDTIKVDLQVADRNVAQLQVGMPAKILVDAFADQLPPEGLLGHVDSIGYAADPVTRTFPVRVLAANPGRVVRAGTHARVKLVLERADDVLYVPPEAVLEDEQGSYVMVVTKETAHRIAVTPGLEGDDGIAVAGDLAADQSVIVRGHFGLPDGTQVEVMR